ncbi:GPI transamidase subunit PIG-U [Crepidotus variabilis]|uniref:GPI transamidase subunit PIG-U n=1 Tax=Crepidotus variabilis TaxID=179855 RepID=A0A9P6JP57_9AGAR|nr:GPI transamidase subunit PIG-U [Crepidotus variabilis]
MSSKPQPPSSSPPPNNNFAVAFCALAAARTWLSLTGFSSLLDHNQLVSSPLTAFSNLKEGIFLFNHDIDPYSGGSFRQSPLLLSLFTTILPSSSKPLASLLWTLNDVVGAYTLVQIWRSRQNVTSSRRDTLVAAAYLLNPYLFLPSLALSTSSFENTLMLSAILFACKRKPSQTVFTLSVLVQLSLTSIIMVLPAMLLLITDPHSHLASPQPIQTSLRKLWPLFGEFSLYTIVLILISTVIAGSWTWIPQTWGATLMLPDLTPNTGMWWYFFTEMFDHFRPFFLMVFSVHLLIYVAPVCLKFQYDPLYAAYILLGILGIFKPYPTLSDPGLFVSMIALFPETYQYMRHPIVTLLLHLHAALLMPLFYDLWVVQGAGNANFFYASTLVFACANGAAIVDALWSGLRVAIGETPEGYVVVQE